MRQIDLQEYAMSEPLTLVANERDGLKEALPSLTVQPVKGTERTYHLTPDACCFMMVGLLAVTPPPGSIRFHPRVAARMEQQWEENDGQRKLEKMGNTR